jgi:pimeloyl-ACP methyl ester carboxylesterase
MDDNNITNEKNHTDLEAADSPRKRRHRARNWVMALGAAALLPAITKAAEIRLRRMEDPEAGEVLSEPLGEKGHYGKSFDGVRIYTEELGAGPTLVLVHGWFCNTDMWHYQKKLLSDSYRLVCFDQRGHRRSECPECDAFSLETLARDLKAVMDDCVNDEGAVLIGHSMGGMSIIKYMEMFPEDIGARVKGVGLVDTTNVPMFETIMGGRALEPLQDKVVEPLIRWITHHPGFADGLKRSLVRTAPFLLATRYLGYGSGASLTQMVYIQEMAGKTTMKGACLAGLGLIENEKEMSLEPLRLSGIPVLIWVGEKDKLTLPEVSIRMKEKLPQADFHLVPDTGHPSYMEEYGLFNETVRELAGKAFKK